MNRFKERIIEEIRTVDNPGILGQVFDFLRLINRKESFSKSNRSRLIVLNGSMSTMDANEIKTIIHSEFNSIEGEWQD